MTLLAAAALCSAAERFPVREVDAIIEQAIEDEVDVINYSIGGSGTAFVGADDIAFLLAADAGGWECETIEVDDLYGTSAGDALRVASGTTDDVERLMLVGHQPTWGYLVRALTGAAVEMKTATLAAVDMHMDSWRHAPEAAGSLAYLLQPRLFADWEL